ncbi:MAG: tetratricopeptide repeat protein [Treponema sp.]|nr:tetratricopeptide repeat protein [Treponema sp.]
MKKNVWMKIFTGTALGGVLCAVGCTTASSSEMYYYQAPSRPMLSSQERENLTEADIDAIIQRGDEEYAKGNYSAAKDLYYEALLAAPESGAYVLVSYGSCLGNLGLYENAITIFNIALEKDPDNETAKENIAICRQQIARQTEAQRQFVLEQQRLQQENIQNLVAAVKSLYTMTSDFIASQSNSSDAGASSESDQSMESPDQGSAGSASRTGSSSSSSRNSSPSGDWAAMQRNYTIRARAAEDHYNRLRQAYSSTGAYSTYPASTSQIKHLEDELGSAQRDLKAYRSECNKRGAKLGASLYETAWPDR